MRYRLGQFGQSSALISKAALDEFLARWRQAGTAPERIEQMRRFILGEDLPELRAELASETERRWLDALHDGLAGLQHRIEIQLQECSYQPGLDGFLCIAGTSPSVRAEVTPGDVVQAGFIAFRHGSGRLHLSSRIFRLECENGAIRKLMDDEGTTSEIDPVRAILERCFDPTVLAEVAGRFIEATRVPLPPREFWMELTSRLQARHGAVARGWLDEAREILDEIDDPTEWDFLNALTEVARERPDWLERYDLEEAAGAFARLRRPAEHPVMSHAELIPS